MCAVSRDGAITGQGQRQPRKEEGREKLVLGVLELGFGGEILEVMMMYLSKN